MAGLTPARARELKAKKKAAFEKAALTADSPQYYMGKEYRLMNTVEHKGKQRRGFKRYSACQVSQGSKSYRERQKMIERNLSRGINLVTVLSKDVIQDLSSYEDKTALYAYVVDTYSDLQAFMRDQDPEDIFLTQTIAVMIASEERFGFFQENYDEIFIDVMVKIMEYDLRPISLRNKRKEYYTGLMFYLRSYFMEVVNKHWKRHTFSLLCDPIDDDLVDPADHFTNSLGEYVRHFKKTKKGRKRWK